MLCWAVEEASPETIPMRSATGRRWPRKKRWWLYTMTVATTGQAMQTGIGWRKALRAAIADNLFVEGEAFTPHRANSLGIHNFHSNFKRPRP